MASPFISLANYDRYGVDTETKGEGRNIIPVGCSIATPDGQVRYMRWGHELDGNNCTLAQFKAWAAEEFGRPWQCAIFFNAPYDLLALGNVGVKVRALVEDAGVVCFLLNEYEPSFSLDSLAERHVGQGKVGDQELYDKLAAEFGGKPTRKEQAKNIWRGSGDWVDPYACGDALRTLQLYDIRFPKILEPRYGKQKDRNLLEVYRIETMLIPVLDRMRRAGVRIDTDRAITTRDRFRAEFQQVKQEWDALSGGIKFSERKRLITFLLDRGVPLPRTENGLRRFQETGETEWGQFSVNKEALMRLPGREGLLIRRQRQLTHYADTFIQSYLLDNVDDLGYIYPQFHQVKRSWGGDGDETGTITGRFSSSGGLNAQNIPARDEELAPLIRGMFVPMNEESVWLKADYQAIEYRLFAHYAGGELRRSYQQNPHQDLHQFVADLIGLTERYGAKQGRTKAKTVNFAKIYGAGPAKMALTLGISLQEAIELVEQYDERIPEGKKIMNKLMNKASVRGYVMTWSGRVLRFQRNGRKVLAAFTALNKVCQGGSADLTKSAMIEVDRLIDWETTKMHLTVHDELDFSVPKGKEGIKITKQIKEAMETCAEFTVPIIAECKLGKDWGSVEAEEKLK